MLCVKTGLGAALLQNGQPVAYASRALPSAETRYAQIEKELLAIVFACERFYTYIYGRDVVHVDSDHKPLETIVLKPLHAAPQCLQRMLLRLQKYNFELCYKRGCVMFLFFYYYLFICFKIINNIIKNLHARTKI